MSHDPYVGKTIILWSCKGYNDKGTEITLTGLFLVEDRYTYEPANYCYSSGYMCFPVGLNLTEEQAERAWAYIDDDQFIPQVAPKVWGEYLVMEREMEFWAEKEYNEEMERNA